MKKILFTMFLVIISGFVFSQTTYYWVGGLTSTNSITIGSNWNTLLNGSGSSRPSATGATDILIFDGTNVGGATPVTGTVTVLANGSITCAQLKFINSATVNFVRATTGTSTMTISGEAGEDFVIESGCTLSVPVSTAGSLRFAMAAANTGRVSGALSIITTQQCRIDNTTGGTPGSFVFTSGATLTSNITSTSSSYAFGSSSQSSEKWVVFEDGAHLYYEGGYSPMGGTAAFSAIDFKPGSFWHHRANNGLGSFVNRKSFGNIIVENNASLTADGPVYRINNLTVNSGCTFITYSSGQTAIMGNLLVNGTLSSPVAGTNELIFAGNATQTISGSGTINVASLFVSGKANVDLNKSVGVDQAVRVIGKLNFNSNQLTGNASFTADGIITPIAGTGTTANGSYLISGNAGIANTARGLAISGTGIATNTVIVAFSFTNDTIYLSKPATATGSGVVLSVTSNGATLETANTDGFNPATGSAAVTGNKTYSDSINYIINAATSYPFGLSTGATATSVHTGYTIINSAVTANAGLTVNEYLTVNAKITLRPLDTVHILSGAVINGSYNASNYIATDYNSSTGEQSIVQYDGIAAAVTLPIGTVSYYLPVTLTPSSSSDFTAAVFEGITANGNITGTPLTAVQKQTLVNAVWNINRLSGSGNADMQLGWNTALEGSVFTTLPSPAIGLIINNGSSWALPIGTGDNTANTVTAGISNSGSFGVSAVPPSQPFIFNGIPAKTYGNADFNANASSLNITQPIVYASSNHLVATISPAGIIHITGAGTTDITASQETDGFYATASITNALVVNKAPLLIKADNKVKFVGTANPTLTITYTTFVAGENESVLLTPADISTTALLASPVGTYPITVSGATAANYEITFQDGVLNVIDQAMTFDPIPAKTYGNADFSGGATSLNITQPITYTSDNPLVATIIANNIHITGTGTALITASQETDGTYPFSSQSRTLTVNKAPLTITADNKTKYQGNANPPLTVTYTGFVLGEDEAVLLTPPVVTTTATISSPDGSYPIEVSGATAANYEISFVNGILLIQNHISFNLLPVKVYGDADFSGGATSLNTTQPLVYSSNNPLVATIVSGNIHITGSGTADITVTQQTDGIFPTASVTRTLTVDKAALTITADNKTKYEGVANPVFTFSYAGFVLGENAGVLQTPPVAATTATIASPPGTYPITVTGATAANYNITFASGALTIIPKLVQTITFNPLPTKTYGNSDFAGGATSTNTGIPVTYTSSNTAVATIIGSNIHIVGAGSCNITAKQAGSDEYLPAPDVIRALVVNQAALTIKADNKSKYEGSANPLFTVTYTGFVLNETETVLQTPPVVATTATISSPPGTYPITVSSATAANYTITFTSGTLTILPKIAQTITFNAFVTKTYGNADFSAGAISTNTTIPITYTSSNTAVATIIGTNIHITGAGTANITASQTGSDVYLAATDVMKVLTVNKAALTIRANDTTKVVGAANPGFTITYTGFVLSETTANLTSLPSVTTIALTNSAPGYYELIPQGGSSSNYSFTYVPGRLTIYPLSGTNEQYFNVFQKNSGSLTVRVFTNKPVLGDIMLFDINGKFIATKNLFMPVGFISTDFPISIISSGMYIVTVRGKDVNLTKMIRIIR
ncbi:MAG: MBG domain-containing protein [Chitinophagaceae bacterium]